VKKRGHRPTGTVKSFRLAVTVTVSIFSQAVTVMVKFFLSGDDGEKNEDVTVTVTVMP